MAEAAPLSRAGGLSRCPSPDVQEGLARNAIAFPDGIPGFEACRRFVLLAADAIAPLQRLESIEGTAGGVPRHRSRGSCSRATAAA